MILPFVPINKIIYTYRRHTLCASDEEGRIRDDARSLSRTIWCRCRWLALPSGAMWRFILVRRRPESTGELVGRRRRRRSEYQRLCISTLSGRVRIIIKCNIQYSRIQINSNIQVLYIIFIILIIICFI